MRSAASRWPDRRSTTSMLTGGLRARVRTTCRAARLSDRPSTGRPDARLPRTIFRGRAAARTMGMARVRSCAGTRATASPTPTVAGSIGARIERGRFSSRGGDMSARVYGFFGTSRVFTVPGIFHRGGVRGDEEHPPTDVPRHSTCSLHAHERRAALLRCCPSLGGGDPAPRLHRRSLPRQAPRGSPAVEHRFWVIPRGFDDAVHGERSAYRAASASRGSARWAPWRADGSEIFRSTATR